MESRERRTEREREMRRRDVMERWRREGRIVVAVAVGEVISSATFREDEL